MNQNQPLLLACWDTNSCCSCWDTNSWGIPPPRFWRNPFFVTGLSARSWIAAISPAHCLGAVLNGTDRRDRPCLFIEPPFSEIHGMVAKLAPNRIPWCLDVWRMFESFSMKQSPKHHFWRLGLQYQNILKSLSSISLSLNPLYVFVFVLAPWFIIYSSLPIPNWPAVESCWWYWWFHYQSFPQCWTVLRRQRKIRPISSNLFFLRRHISVGSICDMFRALV